MTDLLSQAEMAGFKHLSRAERRLLEVLPSTDDAICGPSHNLDDPSNDPRTEQDWGVDRTIRAALLRRICLDPHLSALVDPTGISIIGAEIAGTVNLAFLRVPFPFRLLNCRVMNGIKAQNSRLVILSLDGSAVSYLMAFGAQVDKDVFLRRSFTCADEARFTGARIGGGLECDNGVFEAGIEADEIEVSSSVFFRKSRCSGGIRMTNASIGGNLECDGAEFSAKMRGGDRAGQDALNSSGAVVRGNVFFRNGFKSDGDVTIPGIQISGDLDCTRGEFKGELDARRAVVKGAFNWMQIVNPGQTVLNLRDTSVYALRDDVASWPSKGKLWIEGLTYQSELASRSKDGDRLQWLKRVDPFSPQPYRQMAKIKREEGDERAALEILVELEHRQRSQGGGMHPGSELLRWSIGYGYYPLRAAGAFAALTALSWVLYRRGYLRGSITPTDQDAYNAFKRDGGLPPSYPRFSPFVYSLENSLPLVKFGQSEKWCPDPSASLNRQAPSDADARARESLVERLRFWWGSMTRIVLAPRFLQRYLWLQIALGWLLATVFAAGVAGMIRRD